MAIGSPNHVFGRVASNPSVPEKAEQGEVSRPARMTGMNENPPPDTATCYLCGAENPETRDHVPPRNLFPPPRPTNLITLPCCRACNEGFQLDDEFMRVFLSAAANRTDAGTRIWRGGVVGSSFARSERLRMSFRNMLLPILAQINGIVQPTSALIVGQQRANRYLVRLTKGLLRFYHPDYNYTDDYFHIDQISPRADTLGPIIDTFAYDQRGDGVFQVLHGRVLMFFSSACFLVLHGEPPIVRNYLGIVSI